jgi:excisionase family DNA binding protein
MKNVRPCPPRGAARWDLEKNGTRIDLPLWNRRMMNRKTNIEVTAILVDPREAARRLAISPRTLWQLTKDRVVPSMRIGKCVRYRVADLDDWTRRQIEGAV